VTKDEFYAALREEIPWHWWEFDRDGQIRVQLGDWEQLLCPIAALATCILGMRYSSIQYIDAANELGLNVYDLTCIVKAADNQHYSPEAEGYNLLKQLGIFV